jgi:DNA-binding response OmpR family regulator/KaiC/GvpD/RAD55 family RecA-like ATPase
MEKGRNLVPSGVEPVDKLRGGLDSGKLYLVHGEGPSKSLFGYQFLIEGLKRGEHVALIINYSPEDAVRWFARLGYDCLEDIYSGRLVVLECAEQNFNQIARMKELTPVLNELRWLIGERNPERVVFEPIGRLVIGDQGSTEARSREFAAWAKDIGSTSLLIANGRSDELINNLMPLVRDSFRFELRQEDDVAIRYIFFEKSADIPEQAIEADPSKGIFLVDRPSKRVVLAEPAPESATQDASASALMSRIEAVGKSARARDADNERDPFSEMLKELFERVEGLQAAGEDQTEPIVPAGADLDGMADPPAGTSYSLYRPEPAMPINRGQPVKERTPMTSPPEGELERREIGGMVENLLKPPAMTSENDGGPTAIEPGEPAPPFDKRGQGQLDVVSAEQQQRQVRPQDFSVLMIAADPRTAERMAKSLSEYRLEEAPDGVSGLAKLISFKPDLVVLDIDLRTVDGFELLKHIRANLDVPIIALSSSRLRASDRMKSAELGADYYLTKPFSTRELKQKARQLIARYRRIDEWITGSPQTMGAPEWAGRRATDARTAGDRLGLSASGAVAPETSHRMAAAADFPERVIESEEMSGGQPAVRVEADNVRTVPYPEFVRRIEQMVGTTIEGDAWFSIIGCRVNQISSHTTVGTASLTELVQDMIRTCDVASVNESGDLMILLSDADAMGAKAFTARLHETARNKFKTHPVIWARTFPSSDLQDE